MKPGSVRKPYYAGFLYPAKRTDLEQTIESYVSNAKQQVKDIEAIKAMIVPYVTSH